MKTEGKTNGKTTSYVPGINTMWLYKYFQKKKRLFGQKEATASEKVKEKLDDSQEMCTYILQVKL